MQNFECKAVNDEKSARRGKMNIKTPILEKIRFGF